MCSCSTKHVAEHCLLCIRIYIPTARLCYTHACAALSTFCTNEHWWVYRIKMCYGTAHIINSHTSISVSKVHTPFSIQKLQLSAISKFALKQANTHHEKGWQHGIGQLGPMVAHPDLNDVLCSGKIEQKHNCTHVMTMVCLLVQVHPYWQCNTSDQHNTVYPAGCLTPARPCFAQLFIQPGHAHGVPLGSHDLNHALSSDVPCVPVSKSAPYTCT